MNLEMKLQDVRDEAVKQEQLNGLKIWNKTLKEMGVDNEKIFAKLKQNYGKYFTDTQIRKYMN